MSVREVDDDVGRAHARGWPAPTPLGRNADAVTFPVRVLPHWARRFVVELAEATQTPVDLSAVLVLTVLATAAGGRAVVEVRRGWREPVNLFAAVAMPPGSRKSPVFTMVTAPLNEAEANAVASMRSLILEEDARRRAAEAAADRAQNEADRADDEARAAAIRNAADLRAIAEAIKVPRSPRLLADDATPEALVSLLAEQGGRMGMLSDEGGVFDVMAGRYSRRGDPVLGPYLKAHAGSMLRVDRKGRGPEYVERPALTLGLAVQPAVLEALGRIPGVRGLGLLARFLYSVPASNVGHRRIAAEPVSEVAAETYAASVKQLVAVLAEWDDPVPLTLTDDAAAAMIAFEAQLEPRLGDRGDLGHVADWGSKLAGHVARIAGLLHLAADPRSSWSRPIEVETIAAAIDVGHYFVEHALVAFDVLGADATKIDARAVLAWVVQRDRFTRRELHQAHRTRFPKATDVDPVLDVLDAHGIVRVCEPPAASSTGGRPASPEYLVNPRAR